MISLGIDVGTSFIKLALLDTISGKSFTITVPGNEVPIIVEKQDWSEQNAEYWWELVQMGLKKLLAHTPFSPSDIDCIGIAYQMHGLVLVDKYLNPLRNAIIWNDHRTREVSEKVYEQLGEEYCEAHLRNHPGSFTLSKLVWVKEHEPDLLEKAVAFLLPGDFIAAKLTGLCTTTPSGLSEGTMWDFKDGKPISFLENLGLPEYLMPRVLPNFYHDLPVSDDAVKTLGLSMDARVSYRAGDQVNNGFFMGAVEEGTAVLSGGTSGVIYTLCNPSTIGSLDQRYNTFLHIHPNESYIQAQLVCINALAISYRWVKNNLFSDLASYEELNVWANNADADGVYVFPFGNTSERILGGISTSASIIGVDYNRHNRLNVLRAFYDSLLFVYKYSFDLLKEQGVQINAIHLSPNGVFKNQNFVRDLANLLYAPIHVLEIDGAISAAKGALLGIKQSEDLWSSPVMDTIYPAPVGELAGKYVQWKEKLLQYLGK